MKELKNILKALLKAQSEFPQIPQNGKVDFQGRKFKYALLEDILSAVVPVLRANGVFLNHKIISGPPGSDDNLITSATHVETGECLNTEFSIPKCAKAQDFGGWVTYGRRYSIEQLLGVCSEEDSDGPPNDKADYGPGPSAKGPPGPVGSPPNPAGNKPGNFSPSRPAPTSPVPSANGTNGDSFGAFGQFASGPGRTPKSPGPPAPGVKPTALKQKESEPDPSFPFSFGTDEDDVP